MDRIIESLTQQGAASWYLQNYITITVFFNIVGLVCLIGAWKRKKWGFPALLVNSIAGEIINREGGGSNSFALILLSAIAALLLYFQIIYQK